MMLARECTGKQAGGTGWKAFLWKFVCGSQGRGHGAGGQHVAGIAGLTGEKRFWSETGALEQLVACLGHLVHEHGRSEEGQNRGNIGNGRDGYHLEHAVEDQQPATLQHRSFA